MTAILALWRREILKFVRDRSRVVGALVQPLGFWLLLGLGFQRSFQMPGVAGSDVGYLEFFFPGIIALMILFTAIFSTISVVEERKTGFLQAALVAPVGRSALALGTALGGTTLALIQGLLFFLLIPLLGLSFSWTGIALFLVVGLLTGLAFTSLGVAIAWRMETTRGFHAIMNLVLLPLWFLSGAFFPIEGAAPVLQAVMRVNPVTYAVDGLRYALYGPAEATLASVPLGLALAVTAGFALAMLALAVQTIRRPLFATAS